MAETKNIIWVGEEAPPHTVSIGMNPTLTMPDEATQRKGFYCELWLLLTRSFDGYKSYVNLKGSDSDAE